MKFDILFLFLPVPLQGHTRLRDTRWKKKKRKKKGRRLGWKNLTLMLFEPLHPPHVPTDKNGWTSFGLEGREAVTATSSTQCQTQPFEPEVGV